MNSFLDEFQDHLVPILRSGDLDACERTVVEQIRSLPRSPFDLSIEVNISNSPADAARHFDRFFQVEAQKIAIAAAYTEMNGFYINPELWYCDVFAYTAYGGHAEYDWLSDWQTEGFPRYPIRGMEVLQAVYASRAYGEKSFRDAENMSSLLVVISFSSSYEGLLPKWNNCAFLC